PRPCHRLHRVHGDLCRPCRDPRTPAPPACDAQPRTGRARAGAPSMNAADASAALLSLSLTAYALLGGADLHGGVLDICASGPRTQAQRPGGPGPMGAVGEANAVW